MSLELAPGERLIESRLAAQFGVSRLPVREALHRLDREGLVVVRPNRGASVALLTAHDAVEIFTLRITLEALAARLAAENAGGPQLRAMEATIAAAATEIAAGRPEAVFEASAAFHAQVVAASGNRRLAAVLEPIGHHVARLRALQARSAPEAIIEQGQAAHLAIWQAIARRQGDLAARLMETHITLARDRVLPQLPWPGSVRPAAPLADQSVPWAVGAQRWAAAGD